MKWETQIINNREVLVAGDFKISPCKNGMFQLREGTQMRGNFASEDAAKEQASALVGTSTAHCESTTKKHHKKIMGYSVCSVVKTLGQAGIKAEKVEEILEKNGVTMSPRSLRVQLALGRNESSWKRHGKPAPLTLHQIETLLTS